MDSSNPQQNPTQSIDMSQFKRWLISPAGKEEVRKKLGVPNITSPEYVQRVNKIIEGVLIKIAPYGTALDEAEKRSFNSPSQQLEKLFIAKKMTKEELADGRVDYSELHARRDREVVNEILKDKLGL